MAAGDTGPEGRTRPTKEIAANEVRVHVRVRILEGDAKADPGAGRGEEFPDGDVFQNDGCPALPVILDFRRCIRKGGSDFGYCLGHSGVHGYLTNLRVVVWRNRDEAGTTV